MKKAMRWSLAVAVGLGLLGGMVFVVEAATPVRSERAVSLSEVPQPVKKTIQRVAGKNEVTEIEEITQGTMKMYEAEWYADGREVEILVASDGRLIGRYFETEVDLKDVPRRVRRTILRKAGKHKVNEVEMIEIGNEKIYEAEWFEGGKEIEIQVDSKGKLLSKAAEEEEEEDDDR